MVVTAIRDWLRAAETCRLVELPRQVDQDGRSLPGDPGRRQRYAALVAAYHAAVAADRAPVLTGWWRPRADGPVEVFAGGAVLAADGDQAAVTMPAGGRGQVLGPGVLGDRLKAVPYWVRLAGLTDALVLDEPPAPAGELRPSLEDSLLQVSREPFAWLMIAQPVPGDELARIAQQVGDEERLMRSRSSPEYAVRVARLERRYRELRQAEASGLWWVHLLAGGMSAGSATAVAGLLTASTDLTGLPYVLAPLGPAGGLDETIETVTERSPFPASSRLVAAVAAVPREEIPGLRLVLRPDFDVTPETAGTADPTVGPMISVGRVMDRNRRPVEELRLPEASLNRHTFVCGATGAGKSQTIRHLLEQASAAGLPWLVVEPAKAEYRRMAARLGPERVVAIRPGDPDAPPVGVNPLEPAAGFPLQTHVDLVRALFLAAFEADEPFPQVLAAALTRCYEEQGWDLALGEPRTTGHPPRYPTLGDLQRAADRVVTEIGYGREITDNVRGFVRVRLGSLRLGTPGRFFEGGHPLDFARLLQENVVFEIEDVGDDQDKAFLMGTVIVRLVEHLRVRERTDPEPAPPGLRHLCVFEEAHRLLRRTERPGPAAHAVELFAALLAEIRAYGEGLVVAEQIPSKLVHDVIKNTAVKIIHRLPARDDRDVVGATCNLSELQSQYLVTLEPGTGAVFTDGMDRPVLVQVPDGTGRERMRVPTTRTVDDLVGRRSGLCGAECAAVPCSLRQMRNAQRYAQENGWLTLWAELAVLGHLTGWGTPLPDRRRLRHLSTMPTRLRDCALAHAIDQAVAVRAAAVAPVAAPPALARHVADSMWGILDGVRRCASEEPEWLARPYRWVLVLDEFAAAVRAAPADGAHPRTSEWNVRYGGHLPQVPCAEQLALVRRWFDADTRDRTALAVVAFGAGPGSAVERAVGARRTDADWPDRLEAVLAGFYECRWPHRYLTGPASEGSG